MTHMHHDHYSGLFNVLNSVETIAFGLPNISSHREIYNIRSVLDINEGFSKNIEDSPLYSLLKLVQEKNKHEWINADQYLRLGTNSIIYNKEIQNFKKSNNALFQIDCLAPVASITDKFLIYFQDRANKLHQKGAGKYNFKQDDPNINLTSLVVKIIYGNNTVVLTGDNESQSFNKIRGKIGNESSMNKNLVVKIPHHGSDTSDSDIFFQNEVMKFKNKLAIVAPFNRFNLPSRKVLKKYIDSGYEVYQTSIMKPSNAGISYAKKYLPKGVIRVSLTQEGSCQVSTWGNSTQIIPSQ